MLQQLSSHFGPALVERLTLALNHVLASEPQATQRLIPHAARTLHVSLQGVSPLLHWPEFLAFRITPAGLLEVIEAPANVEGDLHLGIDLSRPGRLVESLLTGRRPSVSIRGDSQLATDVGWLMDNVRWDYEDDLARVVGPVVAHQAARVIRVTSGAVRQALATLARWVPGRGDADTDASARRPS